VIDWGFPSELEEQYQRVLAQTRRLQQELGITPRTLEERYQDYLKRLEEEQRIKEELNRLQAITGQRRPPVKWKV
jgi:CRP-like cAMP-binding protein